MIIRTFEVMLLVMEQNYKIVTNKAQSHKEEFLAVGIMDTGTINELEESICWYKEHFNYNIHVITSEEKYQTASLENKYLDVSYLLFKQLPTMSERANALANNCQSTYFMLVRSDTILVDIDFKSIMADMQRPDHPVCITPLFFNKDKELVPSVRIPKFKGNNVDPLSAFPSRHTDSDLYPFLGVGLYDRALFQRLRGYDEILIGAYWQTMDFGTKCWLYGFPVLSSNQFAFIFPEKQFLIEDRSETENAERFYTKALGVKLIRGRIRVRKGFKTDKRVLRTEVKPRATLYKTDFTSLVENWILPDRKN